MGRSSEKGTRVDVMFSNDVYEAIQQLAIHDGAKTHHISKKVEVSPTIAKLVRLGLDALEGKLPDINNNLSDNLSDRFSILLPDKLSDISDKRIEMIVDRRLTELGLFPDRPVEDIPTPHLLPDKTDNLPDTLPDKDDAISDKVDSLPDSLSDTKNIPSDDSSNSESIAENVQITQTDSIEQVSGEIPQSFSFAGFHEWLGLPKTDRNKVNGDAAIAIAKSKDLGNWEMSKSFKFTKIIGN
jgi:hypothetical protein